jgi:subtilisin family serine protease
LAARGHVVVRVRSGEEPSHVHTWRDVAHHGSTASRHFDGGPIDSTVRHFSDALCVTRAFHSASRVDRHGEGHVGWDDVEESLGLSRTFRLELDSNVDLHGVVDALSSLSSVELATPNYLCSAPFERPREPVRDPRWAHRMIGAAEALTLEPGDPATLVAIIDSGVRHDHPELTGHLRTGSNAVSLNDEEMPHGMTLLGAPRERRPEDDQGHGTGCAGIIGANGYQIPQGVAGACWIIPVKALCAARTRDNAEPTAVGSLTDIDRAVKTAIDFGARVLNLSFGTPENLLGPDDPVPHVEVVRYALARGCVLIAASGNSGDEVRYFPAALPGVIAVGAVDERGRPSHFSTRGDHVCLSAPGEGIPLASLDGYSEGYGTSFAAPFVAGACTLMVARGLRRGAALQPSTLRNLLASSVTPFAAGSERRGSGAGILNVPAALRAVDEALLLSADPEESTATLDSHAAGP